MRHVLCESLINLANAYPIVFLTGDLGFMAFESLKDALGSRFINAGIAEQNMIATAAGLTLTGVQSWVYSIAPFCYARAFEQIRNNVSLNKLPVKLVGNGGGYAYGSMGATHHALEDYGVMSTLEGIKIFVPAFSQDVKTITHKMASLPMPCYLRLGKHELSLDLSLKYNAWRCLLPGDGPLLVSMGPLVGPLVEYYYQKNISFRPEIWVVSEFPFDFASIPDEFLMKLNQTNILCIVEEHVAQGGLGQHLIWNLLKHQITIPKFLHAFARGYLSHTYGSQLFHGRECGLDPESINTLLKTGLNFL